MQCVEDACSKAPGAKRERQVADASMNARVIGSQASVSRDARKRIIAEKCVAKVRAMRGALIQERRRKRMVAAEQQHHHYQKQQHQKQQQQQQQQGYNGNYNCGPNTVPHCQWRDEAEAQELRADVSGLMRQALEADGIQTSAEELIEMEEQLMRDILAEEAALLMEIEATQRERELDFYASQHAQQHHGLHMQERTPVLCPMCSVHNLHLTMSAFHCQCGFRFDVRQDCSTLDQLCERLANAYTAHASSSLASPGGPCTHKPVTKIQNKFGVQLLTLECEHCQFLHIVL